MLLADPPGSSDQPPSSSEKWKGKSNALEDTELEGSDDSNSDESDSETDSHSISSESGKEHQAEGGTENGLVPFTDWDNGEPLTPEERAQIMKLSLYERSHEMNIRRRKWMEADLALDFRTLTDDTRTQ